MTVLRGMVSGLFSTTPDSGTHAVNRAMRPRRVANLGAVLSCSSPTRERVTSSSKSLLGCDSRDDRCTVHSMSNHLSPPLAPHYGALTYMAPLSDQRAGRLIGFLAGAPDGILLDVGCGWAGLLCRTIAAAPGLRGVGVDRDHDALAAGRTLAADLGVSERVDLHELDVTITDRSPVSDAAAAVCIGSSQAWPRPDPTDPRMNYDGALNGLRAAVRQGGRAVFGEGIWTQPPTQNALAGLGAEADEMTTMADLVQKAADAGFAVKAFAEATLDEWDNFESGYTARYSRWLAQNGPDHPGADEVRLRAREQHEAYLRGYRGVLGMAYLQLLAV